MDPGMDSELKSLRKSNLIILISFSKIFQAKLLNISELYTYHNRILEIERQSRLSRDEYEVRFNNKRRKLDKDKPQVFAFENSITPLSNEYVSIINLILSAKNRMLCDYSNFWPYFSLQILEMISNYLPSQDLRNSRLVCSLWNKEMSRALTSRQTLIVTENDCPEATSFIQNARKTSSVALGNICFFDIPTTCPLFKKLMAFFGWTLSGLKLEECMSNLADLAKVLINQAPNLESFSYKNRASPESQQVSTLFRIKHHVSNPHLQLIELKRLHWDEEFGKVELEEIISMCPNLIELMYKNSCIPCPSSYKNLRWDSLTTLNFSPRDELRDEHILALTNLQLKLRRLTMFGVNPSVKSRMLKLQKLFTSISKTLENLELFQHYTIEYRYNPAFDTPFFVTRLSRLKRLNVDFCILKSLKAFNYLPALKSFECKARHCDDWEALLAKKGFPDENLNLSYLNLGSIDSQCLLKFTSSFKMCSNLELDPELIDDKAMRIIIKGFPHLQQLKIAKLGHVSKIPLTDCGLSGLNASTCKKLLNSIDCGSGMNQDKLLKLTKFPAIYHLKGIHS